jgi:hypothetical protein
LSSVGPTSGPPAPAGIRHSSSQSPEPWWSYTIEVAAPLWLLCQELVRAGLEHLSLGPRAPVHGTAGQWVLDPHFGQIVTDRLAFLAGAVPAA